MGTEQTSFGTVLKFGSTVVGNLISAEGADFKMEFVDTSHHGMADRWRTKRPTVVDPGKVAFAIQMTAAQFAALYAMVDPTSSALVWKIIWPFASTIESTFSGWLANFPVKVAEVDNYLIVECEIEITGKVNIALTTP